MKVYYFGCWNQPGHYLHTPDGRVAWDDRHAVHYSGGTRHIDGSLAPRLHRRDRTQCWTGQEPDRSKRHRVEYNSDEYPQGQFMHHVLDNGYTAVSWWDRTQGDTRSGCTSTVLLEGVHTAEVMLEAFHKHFPHVAANMARAGVSLVCVGTCNHTEKK